MLIFFVSLWLDHQFLSEKYPNRIKITIDSSRIEKEEINQLIE